MHTFSYPDALTTTETIAGGILDGATRSITLDSWLRPSVIGITSGAASHSSQYDYTPTSRLDKVTTGTETATYGYLTNSDAIQSLTFKSGGVTRLTTTRSHDASDRLDGVIHVYGGSGTQTFGVTEFDAMNRRKKIAREDGTRWSYGYNSKGEVTSGIREKTTTATPIPGWSHGYSFDEIGNRLTATTNGRVSTYTPNTLNQIVSRTVPRAFDVIGKASVSAGVSVNGHPATRLDEFFHKELSAGDGAVHVPYSITATDGGGTTTRSGGKFLPASPENFTYDADGNLTSDGRFTYAWDAENRLVGMETTAAVPLPARRKLAFAYDAMGRRIRKTVWHGTSAGNWLFHQQIDFIHELGGWNLLGERSGGSTGSFLRTYAWGTDLSGSLSGAGGVGGLLFTKIHTNPTTLANGMDLNGNVTLLVGMTSGQPVATYDYGPFGEPLRQSGDFATLNPFRFSTKYMDDETGLLDYGHRYYIPSLGRWPSKDPIGEKGGINLYGFVGNDGVNHFDVLGLILDSRSRETLRGLHPLLAQRAESHLEETNKILKSKCLCAKALDGLRTTAQQNSIPSANTRARGLTSYHVWGLAYDIGIFELPGVIPDPGNPCETARKYLDDSPAYLDAGPVGESEGLEWGHRFTTIDDRPHYQLPLYLLGVGNIRDLISRYEQYQEAVGVGVIAPNVYAMFLPSPYGF